MSKELTKKCGDESTYRHKERLDCPDTILHKLDDGTVGIPIHDGGHSVIAINYCPWCGTIIK